MAEQPPFTNQAEVLGLVINAITAAVPELRDRVVALSAGLFPEAVPANNALGAPTQKHLYIAGPGTYTTNGANIVLTANFNLIFSDGTKWSYLAIPIADSLAGIIHAAIVNGKNEISVDGIKAGYYKISDSDIIQHTSDFDFAYANSGGFIEWYIKDGVFFPKPVIPAAYVPTPKNSLSKVLEAVRNGTPYTIAAYGDSQVFGYNPGATNNQSPTPWPLVLQNILQYEGHQATVLNYGVTGEASAQILARMKADTNLSTYAGVFFQGGANDRNNGVTIAQFKQNLIDAATLCLNAGVWICFYANPNIRDLNATIYRNIYKEAMRDVAEAMGIEFYDPSKQVQRIYPASFIWQGDGVHLLPKAFAAVGVLASHYFLYQGRDNWVVNPGNEFNMNDGFIVAKDTYGIMAPQGDISTVTGTTLEIFASTFTNGKPNKPAMSVFYLTDAAKMTLNANHDGSTPRTLLVRYGDGSIYNDVTDTITATTIDGTTHEVDLFTLQRGWHTVYYTCTSAQSYFINRIAFKKL